MNGHAPKGGCIGVNGEFYEGGKFLPSNPNRPRGMSTSYRSGKVEIEPYIWKKYEGELKENEKAAGFYIFFTEDYKVIYKDKYEEFIKPYRTAWNEGKRFRILRMIPAIEGVRGGSSELVRFE